ncbi:unnamed protein product [Colias eurytheme]|nr:unnamed protein product [Colias eurytheme]
MPQQMQSQAQSLSLLQQGQLQNAAANDWSRSSMSTSPLSSASSTWGTWGPWGSASEGEAPDAPPYNPWTAPHPLHEFMDKQE